MITDPTHIAPPTAYDILDLNPTCSQDAIKLRYNELSGKMSHAFTHLATSPDYRKGDFDHMMVYLDYHYNLINTPAKRYAYDMTLKHQDESLPLVQEIRDQLARVKTLEAKLQRFTFKLNTALQKNKDAWVREYAKINPYVAGGKYERKHPWWPWALAGIIIGILIIK